MQPVWRDDSWRSSCPGGADIQSEERAHGMQHVHGKEYVFMCVHTPWGLHAQACGACVRAYSSVSLHISFCVYLVSQAALELFM